MLARTWRRPSLRRAFTSSPPGCTSSSCSADRLRELDRFEPELERRAPGSRAASGRAQRAGGPVGSRLAQRHRAPPRAAADEPRRERDLAERPSRTLRPCEQPVEQRAERAPERQLVSDRLRELERLHELGRRPPAAHHERLPAACQRPRLPSVPAAAAPRPLARQRRRARPSCARRALRALRTGRPERQQRQRQRRQEASRPARSRRRVPARDARRSPPRGRRTAARAAPARGSQAGPTDGERTLERRLEPAVEPLDARRLEVDAARLRRLDREARILEPPQ